DTIFYTCGMVFHNTCDLAVITSVPPRQQDLHGNLEENLDEGMTVVKTNLKTRMMRMESPIKIWRILFMNFLQEFLLMILGLVHHKSKNHIIQLESIWAFALS